MSCLIHDLVGFLYSGYSSMALAALACQQLIYIYNSSYDSYKSSTCSSDVCTPLSQRVLGPPCTLACFGDLRSHRYRNGQCFTPFSQMPKDITKAISRSASKMAIDPSACASTSRPTSAGEDKSHPVDKRGFRTGGWLASFQNDRGRGRYAGTNLYPPRGLFLGLTGFNVSWWREVGRGSVKSQRQTTLA